NVWDAFRGNQLPMPGGSGGIGTPDQVRQAMREFEAAGVDQAIFIQQAGNNRHEEICAALELFAGRVMPEFQERHAERERRKGEELAHHVSTYGACYATRTTARPYAAAARSRLAATRERACRISISTISPSAVVITATPSRMSVPRSGRRRDRRITSMSALFSYRALIIASTALCRGTC